MENLYNLPPSSMNSRTNTEVCSGWCFVIAMRAPRYVRRRVSRSTQLLRYTHLNPSLQLNSRYLLHYIIYIRDPSISRVCYNNQHDICTTMSLRSHLKISTPLWPRTHLYPRCYYLLRRRASQWYTKVWVLSLRYFICQQIERKKLCSVSSGAHKAP